MRADLQNVPSPAVDALFALMSRDDYRFDATDLLPILKGHAPERLLEAAMAAVLENTEHAVWMREVLESAPADVRRRVLEETWTRVRGPDFRKIDAKLIGPLADPGQIARGIDLCLKWELAPRGTLVEADHDRQRAAQGILAHVNGVTLLAEILSRAASASYAESAYLLELVVIRIGRELGAEPPENVWLPTREDVRRLIELFAAKVDPADIPTVTVPVRLARIAGDIAAADFADFIVHVCRLYLDAWSVYDERLQRWNRRRPEDRPNNPAWHYSLLPVLGNWGPAALPELIGLLEHPAADHFIPDAISHVSAILWSKPGIIHRTLSTDVREGLERQRIGRALRQPDDTFQASTNQAAELLSARLLTLVSSVQGPASPARLAGRAAEYQVGRLAKLLANIPSPKVLAPVNRAIAAGPIDLYAQMDCIRSLLRQGAKLEDPGMIAGFESSVLAHVSQSWLDQSARFLAGTASEVLVCVLPAQFLDSSRSKYLTQWQKFAGPRDVVRSLGHIQDGSLWSVLLEAATAVSDGQDAGAEIATAVTELLSPTIFPQFLTLIRDGTFFNWCRDDWRLKQLCPRIVKVIGDSQPLCEELLNACRESPSRLADTLAVYTLAKVRNHGQALAAFLVAELDAGKITYKTNTSEAVTNLFKLETPISANQHEVTTRSQNDLRRELYTRAKGSDAVAITCRNLLARIEGCRWDLGRPADEPRHPDIADGQPWTQVLLD